MRIQDEGKRVRALVGSVSAVRRKTDAELVLIHDYAERMGRSGNAEAAEEALSVCELLCKARKALSEASGALMSAAGMCKICDSGDETFYKALQTV